jgi:peroxiredoxin
VEGRITVRSDIDATGDYSGFRVLVADANGRAIDTLGTATTDADGRFQMTVSAPERGIYPLMIWGRQGRQRLASTDYVVAEGDSATLTVELPLNGRRFFVRSPENAALSAYRNTMAQHRRTLVKRIRTDAADSTAASRSIRQTSSTLWNLQDTFPGTFASQLAATESLSLLSGWNDSLVVARAQMIEPSNPRFVEAAQIARRASARLQGQDAALELLDAFETRAQTNEQRAGVQTARVRAFIDSLQSEAALAAAQKLKNEYPNTKWADWADRATYEVNNLLPGKSAPSLAARTVPGDSISLQALRGRPVVLEYYRPGNDLFGRQLPTRNALYRATRADSVAFISISVEPDTLLHDAFTEDRAFPGHHVIAPGGLDDPLATTYNVARVPSRVLIDKEGRIVGRYSGAAFLGFQEDLTQLLESGS